MLNFADWMAQNYPEIPVGGTDYYRKRDEYSNYVASFPGGTVPDEPEDETTVVPDFLEFDEATGLYFDPLTGTYHATLADALTSYNAAFQSQGFQQDLATSVEEYEAEIERLGLEQSAEAKRLSARNVGRMSQEVRNALLAQGRTPQEINQLLAGGVEGGQRSLNDLLQQMSLGTQQQLAGASQFGIGTQLDAEGLAQAQRRISTSQSQYTQNLAESMRQFNEQQQQQASQFAAGLGFQGQQLAQQQGQFDTSQPKWWESVLDFGGKAVGAYASYKIVTWGGAGTCFDASTLVTTSNDPVAISMLKRGDKIRTPGGFSPVVAVHEYDQRSDLIINGVNVTKTHPFVMADKSLELSGNLKIGDMLWGGVEVTEAKPHQGIGKVYNLDVKGHAFYLEGGMLVHTGRDTDAI